MASLTPLSQDQYCFYTWWQVSPAGVGDNLFKERIWLGWHGALPLKNQLQRVLHPFCPPSLPPLPCGRRGHLHRMALYRKCDHRCQENRDSNGRGRAALTPTAATVGTVCVLYALAARQSVTILSFNSTPAWWWAWHTHTTHTPTLALPSISQSSSQVWQTGTYPSCLRMACGLKSAMTSNDKSKLMTSCCTCYVPHWKISVSHLKTADLALDIVCIISPLYWEITTLFYMIYQRCVCHGL